ncbi:MAG TPA: VTT domain-containing protein [Bryobacteraceae bacterium]|nr:VTT domain-containing protein [Bryobacteraceae bacterium]
MRKIFAALVAFGPWGVLVISIIDSMGIPIPSGVDFLLLTVAAGSVNNPQHAYFTALLAVIGSTVGNLVLFQAARHGRRLFGKGEPSPGKQQRFQQWFQRYGLMSVFVPAVTPVVPLPLKVFVISAGALHTPVSRFVAVILLARIIRYFGEAWLGIQLREDAKGFLIRNGWTICGVALAATLALLFLVRLNDRRRQTIPPSNFS